MTAITLLRRFWPALIVLALGIWAARLEYLRAEYAANLAECRSARELDSANARTAVAQKERDFAQAQLTAGTAYAERLSAREPIIVQSTREVKEYAQTDAGRVLCRGAERVRAIDALDTRLAAPADPASRGADPVPTDTAAPTARR